MLKVFDNVSKNMNDKKIEGELKSDNEVVKKISILDKINAFLLKVSRIPLKEKLFFVQYLGIMLKSGISLYGGLKTLGEQTENKHFSFIISDVAKKVEKGMTLSESLKFHEKVFGELFINMVEAGEVSGKLEEVLTQLYVQMKKNYELLSKVKGALTYPVVILFAMLGIGTFMMIAVVPKMIGIFREFDAELPLATRILIKVTDLLTEHGLLVGVFLIVLIMIFIQVIRTEKGKYIFQGILLKLPIFSSIIKQINLARFARTVSTLLKTDIMIIKTFQITANVLGNRHYRKAILEMSSKIKKGSQINEIVQSYPHLFPPVVSQMMSVGEQTGELDNILAELADFYEGEVSKIMNNLPSIIEPVLMLVLGVVVGGMAVAIIMPMYSLGSAM
jgi:type IV pilus assembly protein PilC